MSIVLNIFAVIIAPIIAVWVGQRLQDRSSRRRDKLMIFETLMANRMGWSPESVRAMNVIEIVFADDTGVRECWKKYYDLLGIQEPNLIQQKQISDAHNRLLEAMAKSLGYKNKITWETIENPYMPKGMINAQLQQQNIQLGQEKAASAIEFLAKQITQNAVVSKDDTHAHT